jgi:hypothetical protein
MLEVCKYVKSSLAGFEKFKGCIEREELTFKGLLCLNVPTRWNSTFKMFEGTTKCQSAFQLMEEFDGHIISTFYEENNEKNSLGPLTFAEWECFRIFPKFLRLFYDATMRLSRSLYVTSNVYFQEICGIQMHLQAYSENGDYVLTVMLEKMMTKYNKYL